MNTWDFILAKFEYSSPVILLYVLHSEGSSPGRQGFKMAVAADGQLQGSIGGGIMEHKFVEMAREWLKENLAKPAMYRQVHDKRAGSNQSGMICSGEQTIFLYPVQSNDIPHIRQLSESLKRFKNGRLGLSPSGITFSDAIPQEDFYFRRGAENNFLFTEKTGYKNVLHIIGGGHCALAFSRLMRGMDFYIHVYDERFGLNTMEQNVYVHERHILRDYSELEDLVESGGQVYVVIMTFGYRSDDTAVRALLNKQFKYIGLLGSKKKIEKMFQKYKAENIDPVLINHIHSPVGLPIRSQTPEEIAVSIAAEIIKVKNQ